MSAYVVPKPHIDVVVTAAVDYDGARWTIYDWGGLSEVTPTQVLCPQYFAVTGPFKTKLGAECFAKSPEPITQEIAENQAREIRAQQHKHMFTPIALESAEEDAEVWHWCIRCGALKLGKSVFLAGPRQTKIIQAVKR